MRDQLQNKFEAKAKERTMAHFGPIIAGLSLEIGHHRKRLLGGSAPDPSISIPNSSARVDNQASQQYSNAVPVLHDHDWWSSADSSDSDNKHGDANAGDDGANRSLRSAAQDLDDSISSSPQVGISSTTDALAAAHPHTRHSSLGGVNRVTMPPPGQTYDSSAKEHPVSSEQTTGMNATNAATPEPKVRVQLESVCLCFAVYEQYYCVGDSSWRSYNRCFAAAA